MQRIEVNVSTKSVRHIETTVYVVDGVFVLIDEGDEVPAGAVLASTVPTPEVVDGPPQI